MKKSNVYFVLYLVLLVDILLVIQERDILSAKQIKVKKEMVKVIGKQYEHPLSAAIADKNILCNPGEKAQVQITSSGLVSETEKKSVIYYVKSEGRTYVSGQPDSPIKIDENGNATFESPAFSGGKHEYEAYFSVQRSLDAYLPEQVKKELEKSFESAPLKSNIVKFTVEVKPNAPKSTGEVGPVGIGDVN